MNLVYRCAYIPSFIELTDSKGQGTGIIHGFLTSLLLYMKEDDEIVIAWDTRSERKREIYPGYKAKRDVKDPVQQTFVVEINKQLIKLRRILHLMNFAQYQIDGYEADEIIGALALHYTEDDKYAVILSEDKDYLQLVKDNLHIWQPIKRRTVTMKNFSELYLGLTPEQYFMFRTYTGDASDEIAGVSGCGDKTGVDIALNKQTKLTEKLFKKHKTDIISMIVEKNKKLMLISKDSVDIELLRKHRKQNGEISPRLSQILNNMQLEKVRELFYERRTS